MSPNIRPAVTDAIAATVVGAVSGGVFTTITGRTMHPYMRFVGFLVVVALITIGAWVHQTYMKPKPGAHVEEAGSEPEVDATP